MKIRLSIDAQTIARARKRAEAMGTTVNQLIRNYLDNLAGRGNPEKGIAEFNRLSGQGDSRDWKFNRGEIHR